MILGLRARIALSAITISVVAALVAAFVPDYVYNLRDQLFMASLAPADRAQLARLLDTSGQCSPLVYAFKMDHGFAPWRLNYGWALGGLIVLTAVCGAGFAVVSAGRIAAPIEALASSARKIATGGRQTPAAIERGAPLEIAELHRDFAAMTRALSAADNDVHMRSAAIAHELRTPLSVLRGRLIGVQSGVFALDAAMLESLLRQIGLVDQLVADLNLLASPLGTDMHLDRVPVSLDRLAASVVETLQHDAAERGGALMLDATPIVAPVDPGRIERALVNLVTNAIRYAPGTEIQVSVRSAADQALLAVRDNGPGWPSGDPQSLAAAFARGDESRSRQSGGSGLGLAIVSAIAQAHGGTLRLSAVDGGGALAEIVLPVGGMGQD
jgi:two-component system, OmpR family, sensor histidine kinase AdeS